MIAITPAIDAFIATQRNEGIIFDSLQVKFSSTSKKSIKTLEDILSKDKVAFVVSRVFLWKWILTMNIPVVDKYNEQEYQQILGKILSLASKSYTHLDVVLLMG